MIFENWTLKTRVFHFTKYFLTRNIGIPPGKYLWQGIIKITLRHSFFFWSPPFQNLGLTVMSPQQRGGTDTMSIFSKRKSSSFVACLYKNKIGLYWCYHFSISEYCKVTYRKVTDWILQTVLYYTQHAQLIATHLRGLTAQKQNLNWLS